MTDPGDLEARLSALEARVDEVAADAAATRHLAAAGDRDLADLGVKVEANRSAINALGVQTAGRFERLENEVRAGFAEMRAGFTAMHAGFAETRAGFAEMRAGFADTRDRFDQTAAGHRRIVELLTDPGGEK